MIFTDGIHLIASESLEELHAFAQTIGLPPRWFHNSRRHPHYDLLTPESRERAFAAGAAQKRSRDLVQILRTCAYMQGDRA